MKTRTSNAVTELVGSRLGTATVMFHGAVAAARGLSLTDSKTHSVLVRHGPMTAGELAVHLRLTTGAVTGVIDRLEALKLVRRVADPADRRRVVVTPLANPKRDGETLALLAPMRKRINALVSEYPEAQQALLLAFLTRATEVIEEETGRLNHASEEDTASASSAVRRAR